MNGVTIYLMDPEKYTENVVDVLKEKGGEGTIIYVSLNKTHESLEHLFKEHEISHKNIFIIDCISKNVMGKVRETDSCLYLENPQSLTDLNIAINGAVEEIEDAKVLVLDSLTTLLLYNDTDVTGRFINSVTNRMRMEDVHTVILAVRSDVDRDVLNRIEAMADEVKMA